VTGPANRRPPPPDQEQRAQAVAERVRNVLIDAGAGTGKTSIVVDRLIEMVAPTAAAPPVPIDRLAAITFTRKAAGELRLRIRERLLRELAAPDLPPERETCLREGLAGLDTAWVGTIHSFADRLLRLCPVQAELSPSYEIVEDDEPLTRETFDVLLHAVHSGTLAAELAGTSAAARADEATRTILLALGAGLRGESREGQWRTLHGLDALVAGFLRERDIPPPDGEPPPFDADAFGAAADEFIARARGIAASSWGAAWLLETAGLLGGLRTQADPLLIRYSLHPHLERMPASGAQKAKDFGGDAAAWTLWQAFIKGGTHRPAPLRDDLLAPLHRWLGTRLARIFPVAVALYEKVKARRRALDQLDLLVKLRDLLATDLVVRGEFQQMFDHIFVDEFQDTDPLQAEIVLFLCEQRPAARRRDEIVLRDGALTLVGDPKQSIYRFRRADIAMYDRVRSLVVNQPHLEVTLSANFRSVPGLIDWLNDRFDRVLGRSPDGPAFDRAAGQVFNQPLRAGRDGAAAPSVHVLPFDFGDTGKHNVDEYRRLEGQALARYLPWLVSASGITIVDPLDARPRGIRYGDVAILAVSTWRLPLLFPALDAAGIPYASRGGTLFLSDPLHRQFLLGLRALADRDDGVAEAALLRPPFFAVDLQDCLEEQAARRAGREPLGGGAGRAGEARALIRELRRDRSSRPPGATARDLLDRTAFARTVASGPNAAQRLTRLRELCLVLEQTAADEGLDYDAATARMRAWVTDPVQLDPAPPVATEAVQVLTVHQAKGLEFPVVVLWDGRASWDARLDTPPWRMERDGPGWTMSLDGLAWEEPRGLGLRATEKRYLDAERRRVIYVAATRARDLLVIPRAGAIPPGKLVCGTLLHDHPPGLVRELEPFRPGADPAWSRAVAEGPVPTPADALVLGRETQARWADAAAEAARPRYRPTSVTGEVRRTRPDDTDEPGAAALDKPREGRFGSLFGHTVHRAIGLVLREPGLSPAEAVRRSAHRTGLTGHLDEAAGDVRRALEALRAHGLPTAIGPTLQTEYPVAGAGPEGRLIAGYVDLASMPPGRLDVLDFKTDAPPARAIEQTHPQYVAQVRAYGRLLTAGGMVGERTLRCGLLFTGDGAIRWVTDDRPGD
jgi:ATP-dependent helicase/nuclease subunit A